MDAGLHYDQQAGLKMLTDPATEARTNTVNAALDDVLQYKADRANVVVDEVQKASAQARTLMIALAILAGLMGFGLAFLLARSVARTAREVQVTVTSLADRCATSLAEALDGFAQGDLTVDVKPGTPAIQRYGKDELGQTAAATNRLREQIISCIDSYTRAGRLGLGELVGQVKASAGVLTDTSAQLGSAANQTSSAVQQVAQAIQKVASGAQHTSRGAQDTNAAVARLGLAIDGIARGASEQARQIQSTSATAVQMAAGVEQVASNAGGVAAASQQTKASAEHGAAAVKATVASMVEIRDVVGAAAGQVPATGQAGREDRCGGRDH